jgi:hypothetical protein
MSRLTDLLRRVEKRDPALAKDLAREIDVLSGRRAFGLNFERHIPESVELPGRRVRRGDKVRFRPARGESDTDLDERLWRVTRIASRGDERTAHLIEYQSDGEPDRAKRATADLVIVAEFRDPIYPGLRSTGTVERGGDKPYHAVINAENSHALQALMFSYEGKVDCIYIDPPYNTRDKDWKYNNDYVDADKCHVSHAVADTGAWEQKVAQVLEDMDEVVRYVKNEGLGFAIPYTLEGRQRNYIPDYIAHIDVGSETPLNLIIEVSGEAKKDKARKAETAREIWVPAVNTHGGFGRWSYVEVVDPYNAASDIRGHLSKITEAAPVAAD